MFRQSQTFRRDCGSVRTLRKFFHGAFPRDQFQVVFQIGNTDAEFRFTLNDLPGTKGSLGRSARNKLVGKWRIGKAEDYRRYAAECLRLAQQSVSQAEKALLPQMAETSRRLAEQADARKGIGNRDLAFAFPFIEAFIGAQMRTAYALTVAAVLASSAALLRLAGCWVCDKNCMTGLLDKLRAEPDVTVGGDRRDNVIIEERTRRRELASTSEKGMPPRR